MQKPETKQIKSWSEIYTMSIVKGEIIVQGTGKFKGFVGVFTLSDVRELVN